MELIKMTKIYKKFIEKSLRKARDGRVSFRQKLILPPSATT